MTHDPSDPLSRSMIGRSALRKGVLSEADLDRYRRMAGQEGGTLSLIEYLLEQKGLTPEQVADLLRAKAEPADPAPERRGDFIAPAHGAGQGAGKAESAATGMMDDGILSIEPAGHSPSVSAFSAPPAISAGPAPSVSAADDPLSIEPAGPAETGSAPAEAATRLRSRPVQPPPAVSAHRPAPSAGATEETPRSGTGFSAPLQSTAPVDSASSAGPHAAASASYQMRFGYLSVRLGYVTPDQLGVALDTQKFLQKKGKPARLGEILVSQGVLEGKHVLTLLKLQGKTLLRCRGCGARFNAERFDAAHPIPCRKCGNPLAAAAPGDVADAPSAQGTFTNLPAIRLPTVSVVEPSAVRPVPGPAAKESVKRGAGETETPPAALVDAPTLRPSDAQSPHLSEPPARPPSASRLRPVAGTAVGASGRASAAQSPSDPPTPGRSNAPTLKRSDVPTLPPSHAPTLPRSTPPAQGYVYKEYESRAGTQDTPIWLWPACATGLLVAVIGGWLLSMTGGPEAGDGPERLSPRPAPVAVRPAAPAPTSPATPVSAIPAPAVAVLPQPASASVSPDAPPPPAPAEGPPELSASSAPLAPSAAGDAVDASVITPESLLTVPDSPETNARPDPARALALVRRSFADPPREEIQLAADVAPTGDGGVRFAGRLPEGAPERLAILLLVYFESAGEGEAQFLHLGAVVRQGLFEAEMPDPPPGAYRVVAKLDDAQPAEIKDRITPVMRSWRGELRTVAGSPERLGNETLQWAAELLPAASALRRGWPGLVDLNRRTAAGEPPAPSWEEWKSRNPLVHARMALARLVESPEAGRIVPRSAAAAADLSASLDAMYGNVARAAGDTPPAPFRAGVRTAELPEEVLRALPDDFRRAIAEDADRMFRAAIGRVADAVERGDAGVEGLRKQTGTLEARYEELVRTDGWPSETAGLTDAFRLLRDLLAAAGKGREAAEPVLIDLRKRLQ